MTKSNPKVCSRGHEYSGSGPCPICWPGHYKKSTQPVDDYIKAFPKKLKTVLSKIRSIIKKSAPGAEESFAYAMPAYKLNDKPLVYFSAFTNHIGFYATPSGHKAFAKKLAQYKQGKGSVQFPLAKPIPFKLIEDIVKFRAKEIPKQQGYSKTLGPKESKIVSGYTIKYHANGKTIWSKGKVKSGKAEGYWEWYRPDGTLKRSGYFKGGEPVGEWITYDQKGKAFKKTQK